MSAPQNMPPYPVQRQLAYDLLQVKERLLQEIYAMEKGVSYGDFHDFGNLTRARIALKNVNDQLDTPTMSNYVRNFRK